MSNPIRRYFRPDGTAIPENKVVQGDHFVTTFVVQVRSSRPVGEDEVKGLIQTKFEVKKIENTHIDMYSRN
jgi:hypothetical protein